MIDEDQGKSGATAAGRLGFQRLVAEVSLGRVGAVFGLDVSRLARNNRDWYQLLDLCGLTNTLIADAEGVYDPRQLNDRLLLGLKGTMSEAELGWIRQRAYEGLLSKARRGALILGLPVGYVQTRDGRIEKHPDQRVQQAIALVFEQFAAGGSVRQALLWFRQERMALPSLAREPAWGERVTWRLPVYNTVLKMLTNPCYAGRLRLRPDRHPDDGRRRAAAQEPRAPARARAVDCVAARPPRALYSVGRLRAEPAAHRPQRADEGADGERRRPAGPELDSWPAAVWPLWPTTPRELFRRRRIRPALQLPGGGRQSRRGRCIGFGGLRVDEAIEREILRVLQPGAIEAALQRRRDGR